jgi:AcrR family transcriptional regulator
VVSQRINTQAEPKTAKAANAIPEERILDAAYQLLLSIGMQRITMADIARQAGVSRATLYRRWSGVHEVLGALTTREWSALTLAAMPAPQGRLGRAELVDGVVRLVRGIRVHPLLRKIVEVDPDFLTPYLLTRRGTNTNHQLDMLSGALRLAAADGSVRADDPELLARAVLLTAWSFTLTGPVVTDTPTGAGPELDRLDDELHLLLDRYLTPRPQGGADA